MPNTAKFDSANKVSTLKKERSKESLSPLDMPQMKNLRGQNTDEERNKDADDTTSS